VEATHFESEIPGYYTIYMATVSNGLAVLVTFSVRKNEYLAFKDLVLPCIESLQIKKDWSKPPSTPKPK
jgi:tartrate dehydratase beta subunit/fumarate hydratase class I family protein